mmetsp:Transcript_21362/g.28626  ORF Transcript_21362/g.28626 Transcript_21362/m.28626 type:complete len:288 (+) Transcript_21362:1463-2326(+)
MMPTFSAPPTKLDKKSRTVWTSCSIFTASSASPTSCSCRRVPKTDLAQRLSGTRPRLRWRMLSTVLDSHGHTTTAMALSTDPRSTFRCTMRSREKTSAARFRLTSSSPSASICSTSTRTPLRSKLPTPRTRTSSRNSSWRRRNSLLTKTTNSTILGMRCHSSLVSVDPSWSTGLFWALSSASRLFCANTWLESGLSGSRRDRLLCALSQRRQWTTVSPSTFICINWVTKSSWTVLKATLTRRSGTRSWLNGTTSWSRAKLRWQKAFLMCARETTSATAKSELTRSQA